MRFLKLGSGRIVNVNVTKKPINWEKPSCSKIQTTAKKFLKSYWQSHICCEEFVIPGSRMRVDFINFTRKLAVEVSPQSHHGEYNPFFHKTRAGYRDSIKRDWHKLEWLEKNGFKLIELFEQDFPLTREFFKEKYQIDI